MGFFKKAFKVFSGQEFLERTGVLDDGSRRPGWDYESPDPYSGNVQWDETGRPLGRMPKGRYALDYQYEADRRIQGQRNALWGDAQGALRQGQGLLESYRPGGAAALASGIYGQRAGLYAQQSMALQSPDLLMGYREHKQEVADYERREAQKDAQFMSLLGAGVSLLGLGAGGGAAAAVGAGAAGSYINNQGGVQSYQSGGFAPLGTQRGGQTMFGPGWGQTPYQGGGTFQARMQGGDGAGGQQGGGGGFGAQGGGGGGMPQPQQQRGIAAGGGGAAPLSTFQSGEAAMNAMAAAPSASGIYRRWAEDENRQEFTFVMQQSAAARVMAAMSA